MSDTHYLHKFYINARKELVWDALLNNHNIERWLNDDVHGGMRAREKYDSVWEVDGERLRIKVKSLEEHKNIVFDWRLDDQEEHARWPVGVFSEISFELGELDGGEGTLLILDIRNIPDSEQEESRKLWTNYIIQPLTKFVEANDNIEKAVS